MYHVSVKTDSGAEPVTDLVIRNFIKYDETDANELLLISSMVKSAREIIEQYCNISLKLKTYQVEFDYKAVDDNYLKIPHGPVKTFTSLKSYDSTGTEATVPTSDYSVKGTHFKELFVQYLDSDLTYVAEYEAGYDSSTIPLPEVLKESICEIVKYWYDRNEANQSLPETVIAKIKPYSKTLWL